MANQECLGAKHRPDSLHQLAKGCTPDRRGYTHQRYRRIIDSIRRHMPDASVSGDAIVGFPGAPRLSNLALFLIAGCLRFKKG